MVRFLRPRLVNQTLKEVEVCDGALRASASQIRVPARVDVLKRRGKYVLFHTDAGQWTVIHPRMSGRFAWGEVSAADRVRVLWHFSSGELRLVDQRRLATVVVHQGAEPDLGLGSEALEGLDWLPHALGQSRMPIKVWLMDQRKIAGIGNIYASEICFRAGVDPRRPACELREEEVKRLVELIPTVLEEAIDRQGTTLADGRYKQPGGAPGSFSAQLSVYGREGAPCHVCGEPLVRLVQSSRSTYACPRCQRC